MESRKPVELRPVIRNRNGLKVGLDRSNAVIIREGVKIKSKMVRRGFAATVYCFISYAWFVAERRLNLARPFKGNDIIG